MIKQNKHLLSTADPDNNIYNNTTNEWIQTNYRFIFWL